MFEVCPLAWNLAVQVQTGCRHRRADRQLILREVAAAVEDREGGAAILGTHEECLEAWQLHRQRTDGLCRRCHEAMEDCLDQPLGLGDEMA